MIDIENINNLTPQIFNEICNDALNPRDAKIFTRGLKYLEISSIGHFMCMSANEIQSIQEQPSLFWNGEFKRHFDYELKRVSESYNIIKLLRFEIGKWLFTWKANNVTVQVYSYFRRSNIPLNRLGAKQMFIFQQNISTHTEDYKVLSRMKEINKILREAETQKQKLKKDYILMSDNYYHFQSDMSESQIDLLINQLLRGDKNLILDKYKGGLYFIFSGQISNEIEFEFPIRWNTSGAELIYLFYCLSEFKLISNNILDSLPSKLILNFRKKDGSVFLEKSFSRVQQRDEFQSHTMEKIQKEKGRRYTLIYNIVKNVANKNELSLITTKMSLIKLYP